MDKLTKEARSENMRKIQSKNTKPEMVVRSLVHRMGYRFRLHRKDLAGQPDLVLPRHRIVIFVHGCFWHQHSCIDGHVPRTRTPYWQKKLKRNVERDREHIKELREQGWKPIIVWECQTKRPEVLEKALARQLQRKTEPS